MFPAKRDTVRGYPWDINHHETKKILCFALFIGNVFDSAYSNPDDGSVGGGKVLQIP